MFSKNSIRSVNNLKTSSCIISMSDTDNTIKIDDPSPQDKREECDKELIDSTIPGAAFGGK